MKLDSLKIIVTGGAGGMGAHFAHRLHEAGATVVVGDMNEELLSQLPEGIHHRSFDVGDEQSCIDFVAWANEVSGGINALINNAGIIRDGLLVRKDRKTGEVTTLSKEKWDQVIRTNLDGPTWMTREVVADMVRRGDSAGVIVNMSSISRHGNRGQSNYVASKASVAANTVTWSREFAPYGARVGAIAPGMVETPMTRGMNQKARDAAVAAIPVGRIGVPEDLWLAVRFVLECDYFNGRTIDVDGGMGF